MGLASPARSIRAPLCLAGPYSIWIFCIPDRWRRVLEYEAMSGRREQLETHYYKGKSALLFRFIHAGRGIRETWRKESNFRIQVLAALVVLPAAVIFPLSAVERAILVLVIALILTLEIVNSIFERLLDIVPPQFSEDVRRVKDSMAGAVFVASAASGGIGALIFAHPLVAFDAVFEQVLSALRTDTVVRGAQIITMVGDWKALGTATAVYSLVLLLRKSYRQLSFLFGSMATGALLLFVLKEFFARARPHGIEFVAASGYSFPSGHVFMATIFFLERSMLQRRRTRYANSCGLSRPRRCRLLPSRAWCCRRIGSPISPRVFCSGSSGCFCGTASAKSSSAYPKKGSALRKDSMRRLALIVAVAG